MSEAGVGNREQDFALKHEPEVFDSRFPYIRQS